MIAGKAKILLQDSGIEGVDKSNVFAYKIPNQSYNNDTGKKMWFLFTDISEYPEIEGSNSYRATEQHVMLKIFFPVGYADDFSVVQNKIIKYMKTKKFRFHDASGVTALPDTDRLSMSIQFWCLDVLNEAI